MMKKIESVLFLLIVRKYLVARIRPHILLLIVSTIVESECSSPPKVTYIRPGMEGMICATVFVDIVIDGRRYGCQVVIDTPRIFAVCLETDKRNQSVVGSNPFTG